MMVSVEESLPGRIGQSLQTDASDKVAIWWRGYISALDEWGAIERASKAFDCLPAVNGEPSLDSFGFDFEIDVFDADVEIPMGIRSAIDNQLDVLPEDDEVNNGVWLSRIDSALGVTKTAYNHGELRKLLLGRLASLRVAFVDHGMPEWLLEWWCGYVYAMREAKLLTKADAETFNEWLPNWSVPKG